ncbi:MAG: CsiV family protein [Gammaproteobacteria bacterium]
MQILTRILPIAALLLAAAPAAAQDWFAVEVIVFEHRDDAAGGERFPADPGNTDFSAAVDVQPPTAPRTLRPFEQLRPEALTLGGALRTLERSSRYQALVHFGWMQPGLSREDAVGVRISMHSGQPLSVEPLTIEMPGDEPVEEKAAESALQSQAELDDMGSLDYEIEDFAVKEVVENAWLTAEELRVEFAAPPVPARLQGTVTLALQRFMHIDTDVVLTTDTPLPSADGAYPDEWTRAEDWQTRREGILSDLVFDRIGAEEARARLEALEAEPRFQAYRVTESRRVRRDELHYFDHPRVGVIVSVRQIPAEEIEARRQAYDDAVTRASEFRQ